MPSWPQGWHHQPSSRKTWVEELQQTATVLRASPVRHSVVVGPCLLTRRFAWAYLWVFPPPGTQGRSATPHQHLSSPWAPTRLLLPEGQVHTHIQRPLLEPVLAGKVTSHFKTLPLFTAKPVAFCQQRQQILFAGQHYSLQNCPLFTFLVHISVCLIQFPWYSTFLQSGCTVSVLYSFHHHQPHYHPESHRLPRLLKTLKPKNPGTFRDPPLTHQW